jgi:SAM-dependent methyltransferase
LSVNERFFPEVSAGGFTRYDGTIQFYTRVKALLRPDMVVIDFGAGRGAAAEDIAPFRRDLVRIKGNVKEVIGVDVSDAVLKNPNVDRGIVSKGGYVPVPDGSVDLVISDATLEHVANPDEFSREIARVLRPGGWLCARTPNLYSLLVLASALVPNSLHTKVLSRVQPGRKDIDVFPTVYKMNTKRSIGKFFPEAEWVDCSYTWSPEPAYHFNNSIVYKLTQIYQYLKNPFLGGEMLLVFMQKR